MPLTRRLLAVLVVVFAWFSITDAARAQSIIRDTEIESIIRDWSDPVLDAMGLVPDDVTILLINDPTINAFATRGQIMGLHTGLILEAETPLELLGVIAHEGGHIKGRHVQRDGAQNAGMQPFLVSMALGALAVAAGAPDAGAVLMASSPWFGTIGALQYLQSQEGEADLMGARALNDAGLSARGLLRFFERFRFQEVFSDQRRFPYFRSHPLSDRRIENLRRPVERMSNYNEPENPQWVAELAMIHAKIRAFLEPPNQTFRNYRSTDQSLPARYARAIAWYRDGQTERALGAIDELIEEDPENAFYWELRGQVLFEAGRAAEAVPAHARSVELMNDAPLLRINHAHALLQSGDPADIELALSELRWASVEEPQNPLAWRLMADAYGVLGDEGRARLASAELAYSTGQMRQARDFALRARDRLDRGSPEWVRAMDIAMQGGVTDEDFQSLDRRARNLAPSHAH